MSKHTYAELSTAHITPEDNELLLHEAVRSVSLLSSYSVDEGYFVVVPSDGEYQREVCESMGVAGYSPAFIALLKRLRHEGHDLLRLDADGDRDPLLPQYDW